MKSEFIKKNNFSFSSYIVRFPDEGIVIAPPTLKDQGQEILGQGVPSNDISNTIPILGFYQSKSTDQGGRIVTYGDSNCIDRYIKYAGIFFREIIVVMKTKMKCVIDLRYSKHT